MPLYLYHKKHKITGLNYFGKTDNNPVNYNGSGVYWNFHSVNRKEITCPHCNLIGTNKSNMNRYHFDKCKKYGLADKIITTR